MGKAQKTDIKLSQAALPRQDLRLFSLLAQKESDFLRLASELEADPLFIRLLLPGADGRAPVRRRRLSGASYAFVMAASDGTMAAAAGAGGTAGEWLSSRPEMIKTAQDMGVKKFERYFLSETFVPAATIARDCGLTVGAVEALRIFVDSFLLAHERIPVERLPELFVRCVARIDADGEKLCVAYTHPAYFRGAYSIDGAALSRLVRSGGFSREEAARARTLTARAQRIAWRKSGFHRMLTALIEEQAAFLLKRAPLKPLSQRGLAERIGLNPGTISRLIAAKTIMAPWGGEIKLKDFFRQKKGFIIGKIKEILGEGDKKMTDREVAISLKTVYGMRVSRRSVNLYRTKSGLCPIKKKSPF